MAGDSSRGEGCGVKLEGMRQWMQNGCPVEDEVYESVKKSPAEAAVPSSECRSFRLYVAPVRGVLMAQCGGCGEVVENGGLERRPDKGEKSVDGVYDTAERMVESMCVHGGGSKGEVYGILLDPLREYSDRYVKPWLQMGGWVIASMLNGVDGGDWIGQPPSVVRSSGWAFSFSPTLWDRSGSMVSSKGPHLVVPASTVELEPRYPSWASRVFHRLLDGIFPDKART